MTKQETAAMNKAIATAVAAAMGAVTTAPIKTKGKKTVKKAAEVNTVSGEHGTATLHKNAISIVLHGELPVDRAMEITQLFIDQHSAKGKGNWGYMITGLVAHKTADDTFAIKHTEEMRPSCQR
ncbi:MAG: hypothetical protein IZT57_04225, partial [Chloroflexi bacterium]|nr:hypothetical protein [Chloroflexota bacterium]